MMKRFDFKSIKFRLWITFLSLSIGILVLIWFLQIYFLNNQYENMKINQVEDLSNLISRGFESDDENLTNQIREYSINSDIYVMMESSGTLLLFMPEQDTTTPVYKYREELPKLRSMLNDSDGNSVSYNFSTHNESYQTLAFGKRMKNKDDINANLYIFAPLYPMTSTVNILKEQLVTVTIIALFIAFLLAIIFSSNISKPLRDITRKTKEMGKGNYDLNFNQGSSYTEINNLAKTLNQAAYELGREDNIQKDLIANVSHDLKTPLTMIKSYAEMIIDLDGDDKEKREKHLNVIIHESERMANLVSSMSQLSQLQNQKIELNKKTFDLSKAISDILLSNEVLEKEGYTFTFNAKKECLAYADPDKIKQVISNLIGNAVKYSLDNKDIKITIQKQGKYYKVSIIDNGPGIPEESLPYIWDRYYRESKNYKREVEGSGLGLYITKQILNLHNFNYGVTSKVGHGSTFWFEIEISNEKMESN